MSTDAQKPFKVLLAQASQQAVRIHNETRRNQRYTFSLESCAIVACANLSIDVDFAPLVELAACDINGDGRAWANAVIEERSPLSADAMDARLLQTRVVELLADKKLKGEEIRGT